MSEIDTYAIAKMYKYLRVCDVGDALDAVGRADLMLVDPEIRPLFIGTKFWGVAVTQRALPANKRMPILTREQAVQSHRIWFQEYPQPGRLAEHVKEGSVVCTDASQCGEVGIWGSNNALEMIVRGAVGIVSDGYIRDTAELRMTNTPVVARARGRTIIPGRNIFDSIQQPIGIGGVLVRPGDIVGCDDDGVLVVPAEIAEEVGKIASDILIDDEKGRKRHYERLGLPLDESVDIDALEEFYKPWK